MLIMLALISLVFINSGYGKQFAGKMTWNNFKREYNKNKPIDVEIRGMKTTGNGMLEMPILTDEENRVSLNEFPKSVFYRSVDNVFDKIVSYPIEMYYDNGDTLYLRYYGHSFFLVSTKGRSFTVSNSDLEKVVGKMFDDKGFTFN